MKILQVITGLHKAAGTSALAAEIANEQVKAGHDVTLAICNPSDPDRWPLVAGVKVVSIADAVARIRTEGRAWDVMHIHAMWDWPLHQATVAAKRAGIPIVRSPQGNLTPWALKFKWWKKWPALALYQWWDLRKVDCFHCAAEMEIGDVRGIGLKNKVAVIPLGVAVRYSDEELAAIKAEPKAKKQIVFVSRVQKKKGLFNLVDAWAEIVRSGKTEKFDPKDWEVIVAGPSQEGHGEEVVARAKASGISDSFHWIGPVYGDEKDRTYARGDIFCLPTHSENFGIVVIDALAAGTPAITTKGAPWEILEGRLDAAHGGVGTGKCGWWIDIGVEPLVAALREAMSLSDQERREMGGVGRDLVFRKYTWPAISAALVGVYEGLQ